jgi:hypothetical protein
MQGEILVGVGSRVDSAQVVGRANLPGGFRILAVARLLKVSTEEVERHLQVKLGDTVRQGDVVARTAGLLGRSVRSPIDGIVTARGGGRVLIEAQPIPFELRAYIPGTVSRVVDSLSVEIETTGVLIRGSWGSGGEGTGVLKVVGRGAGGQLSVRGIDSTCHGGVLVAAVTLEREALQRAADVEALGLVTGGLSSDLVSFAEQLSFPIIVTEGIGDVPMARAILDLLKTNEGKEASISGQVASPWSSTWPEIIIPRPDRRVPTDRVAGEGGIRVGTQVRIVRPPRSGTVGTVVGLPRHARRIETGARARCADVKIGPDAPVSVPLVNLDVLA